MPQYRAKSTLFVAGARIRAGETFRSDKEPSPNWEPLDEPAHEAVKKIPPAEKPAPAPAPVEATPVDPWAKYTDQQIRDFIETKAGRQPGPNASRETLITRAKSLVGTDGAS